MFSDGNKNLIITYAIAIASCAILVFVMFNFNSWFFPDKKLELNTFTTSSRGTISEKDLNFGVLSDKKFVSLEPILAKNELDDGSTTPPEGGTTKTVTPTVKPVIELRHSSPFIPF